MCPIPSSPYYLDGIIPIRHGERIHYIYISVPGLEYLIQKQHLFCGLLQLAVNLAVLQEHMEVDI